MINIRGQKQVNKIRPKLLKTILYLISRASFFHTNLIYHSKNDLGYNIIPIADCRVWTLDHLYGIRKIQNVDTDPSEADEITKSGRLRRVIFAVCGTEKTIHLYTGNRALPDCVATIESSRFVHGVLGEI